MNLTNIVQMKHITGLVKLTSNGDGAASVKVTITARSGDPVDIPGFGLVVHDFSGMASKNRIPLDIDHDDCDSIGYLSNFDTSTGDLVCSGAIVLTDPTNPEDEVTSLVTKMLAGVPYEASIQTRDDMTLQFVPEGTSVIVNGNTIDGPVTVVTDWTLKAVAICKFGADSDTSSDILLSKQKNDEAKESQKGFFIRFANNKTGINIMTTKLNKPSDKQVTPAVEAKAEIAPEKVAIVEAVVEAEKVTQLSEVKVEAKAEVIPAVAVEANVAKVEDKKVEVAPIATELSKTATDPRKEFSQFVTTFGNEKAAIYFSEGLSFADAMTKFSIALKEENETLKTKLAAVDRGADSPVRFSKVNTEAEKGTRSAAPTGKGLASIITLRK